MLTELIASLAGLLPGDGPRLGASDPELPSDVVRLLSAVGGRSCGALRFLTLVELEGTRRSLTERAPPLWNPTWYPLARAANTVYAYDPTGCFRGRRAQIVCFDIEDGAGWTIFATVGLWIGGLVDGLQSGAADGASDAAHRWVEARGELYFVTLTNAQQGRFETPRSVVIDPDVEYEHTDFTLFVLHVLSRGLDQTAALLEIERALDDSLPHCGLRGLSNTKRIDAHRLASTWLAPHLAKHRPGNGDRLLFQTDTSPDGLELWVSVCGPNQKLVRSAKSSSRVACFGEIERLIRESDVGWCGQAWSFIAASAVFLVSNLLDACAAALPPDIELDVTYGGLQIGRCDRDGFVPTPLTVARERLRSERARSASGLARMKFPGRPPRVRDHPVPASAWSTTRSLSHRDGRAVEVTAGHDTWHCTIIESNGERDTFSRPVKSGWEVETLIASQRRAGFVEV